MKKSPFFSVAGVITLCLVFISFTGFTSTTPRTQQLVLGNLLQNGSFEDSGIGLGLSQSAVSGWYVWHGTVDVIPNAPSAQFSEWHQAAEGAKSLEMIGTPGVGGIAQYIQTEVGRKYTFNGWISHHPGIWEAGVWVWVDDRWLQQPLFHNAQNSKADMKWERFSIEFTAKSPQTLIGLMDQNRVGWDFGGAVIDDLTITLADNSQSLPPDPGEEGKKTLAGIDSDRDGVRDDAQIWVHNQFPTSERKRAAARQIAVDMQDSILMAADKNRAEEVSKKLIGSLDCASYVLLDVNGESVESLQKMVDELRAIILNTWDRSDAYMRSDKNASGAAITLLPDEELKNACRFNLQGLKN